MAFGQQQDNPWDAQIVSARNSIDKLNLQIADIENQIASIEADNAKFQKMLDDLALQEAAQVVVSPALPPASAIVVTPTPVVTAVVTPTPVVTTVAPEVTGQPGIAPAPLIPEEAAAVVPEALLAGMPSWTWILVAGAAVFLLFGGKGISGEEGKKPKRVRRRK